MYSQAGKHAPSGPSLGYVSWRHHDHFTFLHSFFKVLQTWTGSFFCAAWPSLIVGVSRAGMGNGARLDSGDGIILDWGTGHARLCAPPQEDLQTSLGELSCA